MNVENTIERTYDKQESFKGKKLLLTNQKETAENSDRHNEKNKAWSICLIFTGSIEGKKSKERYG